MSNVLMFETGLKVADSRSYEALKKMKTELFVYKDSEDIVQMYDKWAETYEGDIDAIGYQIHDESAEVLMRRIGGGSDNVVLDVLCGTGLVGFHLKRRGFSGTLHGLDGSDGMLTKAAEKKVYHTLTKERLEPSQDHVMGGKLSNLDAVTCVGGFLQGHLDPKILPKLAALLKRGGCLVYTARVSEDNEKFRLPLENEAKQLVNSGVLREGEIVKTTYGVDWDVENYDHIKPSDQKPSDVWIYCYEKC